MSIDGQPLITTESANNTLEFWSVDNVGNPESPHKILTEIKLDKTSPVVEELSRSPEGDVESYQEVKVTANITDTISLVKNATLQYSSDNGTSWSSLPFSPNSTSGYYEATIPGHVQGTMIGFKISAYDYAGNKITTDVAEPISIYRVIPEFQTAFIIPFFIIVCISAWFFARKVRFRSS